MLHRRAVLACLLSLCSMVSITVAADWPQWRGANRDGYSSDTGLAKEWPKGGPKLLWTFEEAGVGYGTPAVVGDTVYFNGGDEAKENEFLMALDIATGKPKWKTIIPIEQKDSSFRTGWGGGPRSTPSVDGDRVYTLGAQGDLACLDTGGKIIWHRSLTKDLGGKVMKIWGYSESPLVDGDLIICMPGYDSSNGQGTVQSLDKKTGEVKWVCQELTDAAPYSSLVITETGGVKQYVAYTESGVSGIRATDGKLLWKAKVATNDTAIIPTPIIKDDLVYVTNSYNVGCAALKLSKDGDGMKADQLYFNKTMQNHHSGVIRVDDHVYGSNGNANHRKTLPFLCQEIKTGTVAWKKDKPAKKDEKDKESKKSGDDEQGLEPSSLVFADGPLYCYGQNTGMVVKIAASPKGYKEQGRFTIPKTSAKRLPEGGIWTHPVIAQGKLFLRDQDLLFCYDLK